MAVAMEAAPPPSVPTLAALPMTTPILAVAAIVCDCRIGRRVSVGRRGEACGAHDRRSIDALTVAFVPTAPIVLRIPNMRSCALRTLTSSLAMRFAPFMSPALAACLISASMRFSSRCRCIRSRSSSLCPRLTSRFVSFA